MLSLHASNSHVRKMAVSLSNLFGMCEVYQLNGHFADSLAIL